MNFSKCTKIVESLSKKKKIHEMVAMIENVDGSISWNKGYNRTIDSPLLMASVTKLFATASVLILKEQGKIFLDDKISKYLDKDMLSGLHVYKGTEYSYELTISDLLFQVSGLPDYLFEGKETFVKNLLTKDAYIDFDRIIAMTKSLKPHFEPRKKGKSHYADTNFDILGKIIENITQLPLHEVYQKFIFEPLSLKSTYVITKESDFAPNAYYKQRSFSVVNYLRICPASGGGISTARELMIFLKAFWGGILFNKAVFEELTEHNCLQLMYGGIHYAGGYMHINSGMSFTKKNRLIGHSGVTGSFAFYCPQTSLFFVGDVNQLCYPSIGIRLLMQLEISTRNLEKTDLIL